MSMPRLLARGLRAAVNHLTRIPAGGFPYSDDEWTWATACLPMVGAAIGALAAGVWVATSRAGHLVSAILVVGATAWLTGAIHEDGLADTADALGGGRDRARILAILKDSRIGAFGAVALVVALHLRVALPARLGATAPLALVLAGAASRLGPVWLMGALSYVTSPDVAKSAPLVGVRRVHVAFATSSLFLLSCALWASGAFRLVDLALVWASIAGVTFVLGWQFHKRVGGITGDFLGAAQQVSECAMLLALGLSRGDPA